MSRLIIVSCGNSLSQQAVCWEGLNDALHMGKRELFEAPEKLDEEEGKRWMAREWVKNKFDKGVGAVVESFDTVAWEKPYRKALSAELATLWQLDYEYKEKGNTGIARGTEIRLFYGDGIKAEADALRGILSKVKWSDKYGGPNIVGSGPVSKLDADDAVQYKDVLNRALNDLYNEICKRPKDGYQVTFCLSGGFKGTVAGLHLLARELKDTNHPVRSLYLHETSPGLIDLPLSGFQFLGRETNA